MRLYCAEGTVDNDGTDGHETQVNTSGLLWRLVSATLVPYNCNHGQARQMPDRCPTDALLLLLLGRRCNSTRRPLCLSYSGLVKKCKICRRDFLLTKRSNHASCFLTLLCVPPSGGETPMCARLLASWPPLPSGLLRQVFHLSHSRKSALYHRQAFSRKQLFILVHLPVDSRRAG